MTALSSNATRCATGFWLRRARKKNQGCTSGFQSGIVNTRHGTNPQRHSASAGGPIAGRPTGIGVTWWLSHGYGTKIAFRGFITVVSPLSNSFAPGIKTINILGHYGCQQYCVWPDLVSGFFIGNAVWSPGNADSCAHFANGVKTVLPACGISAGLRLRALGDPSVDIDASCLSVMNSSHNDIFSNHHNARLTQATVGLPKD